MKLLCFDEGFAIAEGWPVFMLDITLTGLVVAVTVIGLKSVGILMVALLITPPTAARFWTENLGKMIGIAAGIGGVSAVLGSLASALFDKLAGGPTIVLTGTMFFLISLMFGTERGIVCRWLRHRKTQRRIGRADLLRAMFEIIESRVNGDGVQNVERLTTEAVEHADLVSKRSWTAHRVNQIVSRGVHELAADTFGSPGSESGGTQSSYVGAVPDYAGGHCTKSRRPRRGLHRARPGTRTDRAT